MNQLKKSCPQKKKNVLNDIQQSGEDMKHMVCYMMMNDKKQSRQDK
jgi:hypothetical protein